MRTMSCARFCDAAPLKHCILMPHCSCTFADRSALPMCFQEREVSPASLRYAWPYRGCAVSRGCRGRRERAKRVMRTMSCARFCDAAPLKHCILIPHCSCTFVVCRLTPFDYSEGFSPLHYASIEDHLEVVRFLVGAGADVNARDK